MSNSIAQQLQLDVKDCPPTEVKLPNGTSVHIQAYVYETISLSGIQMP
jgi:hypothetical protein